jgi:nitrous oxide reductase accessory protein NosL
VESAKTGENKMTPRKRRPGTSKYFFFFLTLTLTLTLLFALSSAVAAQTTPVKPLPKDKCPVCGMFVAKYPDIIAEFIFSDGSYAVFDGVKDMFKDYFNLKKYHPSKGASDIRAVFVTDYYTLGLINGYEAFYVLGSDVYGPMGKELIPFEEEEDAKGFMKDHKGKAVLRFKDVTSEMIKPLD